MKQSENFSKRNVLERYDDLYYVVHNVVTYNIEMNSSPYRSQRTQGVIMKHIVQNARTLAEYAHQEQKYGEHPYTYHLKNVHDILIKHGIDDQDILCAAWLHDIIEDTDYTVEKLFTLFGRSVTQIVWAVTNEQGKNRAERHSKTYPKIREYGKPAVAVKLADRIANVTESVKNNPGLLTMYEKEYKGFKDALYQAGELDSMWTELDQLLA